MADLKISAHGTATIVVADLVAVVVDPAGVPITQKVPLSAVLALAVPSAAPGMVLLEQHTAAASSELDFTTAITSAYDDYLIEILNLVPSATAQFQVLVSTDGGATWKVTGYISHTYLFTGGFSTGLSQTTTFIQLGSTALSGAELSASMRCSCPLAALPTQFYHHGGYKNGGDSVRYSLIGAAWYESTTPVNALRFKFNGATITSGVVRIYGLAK